MNLRTKLIAGYSVVTCFTFIVAAIGIWQTRRLADGLYEIGVVRLPSIQALQSIFEAKTALDASKRELMRGWAAASLAKEQRQDIPREAADGDGADVVGDLEPAEETANYPADVRGLWNYVLVEELRRQASAWRRAEKGWKIYESQPRTPEEDQQWQQFKASWTAWRASYKKVMDALHRLRETGDPAALAAARTENDDHLYDLARDSRLRLTELIHLSDRIADKAMETSIASRGDAQTVRQVMLIASAASVLGAILAGIFISRRICRAIDPMAQAFARVAEGDLRTRVPVASRDEIGRMAESMNSMIGSLDESEAARARSAAALADTAERLALALSTSRLGLWRRNLVTNEAEWDAQMYVHFGLVPSNRGPVREDVLALVAPDDREAVLKSWSLVPAVGEISNFRFQIIRPDGVRRHLEAHGIVQLVNGRPSQWSLGVVADITDVVESTVESARLRERLSQAQRMETLGGLAAGVAHDFNNLLTSIGCFIELAANILPVKHEATELLSEARAGADRARDLVKRILTYARGSRETRRAPLDLERVVQQALPLIVVALPSHVEINVEVSRSLPLVSADSGQVQQVLMNLCTNAAHAIGLSGGNIRVAVQREIVAALVPGHPDVPAGEYVCLVVRDTGSGMDAATLERIFEPYFTTKGPEEGTGLGLSNVSDIVTAHGGGMTVASTLGKGTEFRIYFPAHAVAPPARAA